MVPVDHHRNDSDFLPGDTITEGLRERIVILVKGEGEGELPTFEEYGSTGGLGLFSVGYKDWTRTIIVSSPSQRHDSVLGRKDAAQNTGR